MKILDISRNLLFFAAQRVSESVPAVVSRCLLRASATHLLGRTDRHVRFLGCALLTGCAGMAAAILDPEPVRSHDGRFSFLWRRELTSSEFAYRPEEFSSPEIDALTQRIFVGSRSGAFFALRMHGGGEIWKFQTEGAISGRPLVVAKLGMVFVGSDEGHLYALSTNTPKASRRWDYATTGMIRSQPAYHDGILFFTSSDNHLFAVDAETGRWRWSYRREKPDRFTILGDAGVTVGGEKVFCGFSDGVLAALDQKTGEVIWSRDFRSVGVSDFYDIDGRIIFEPERRLLYLTSTDGGVWALRADDGTLIWHQQIRGARGMQNSKKFLYVTSAQEGVIALGAADGQIHWKLRLDQGTPSIPLIAGRSLLFSTSEGGLILLDRFSRQLRSFFPPGGGISGQPVLSGNQLYFVSNAGYLYAADLF